MKTIRTSMVMPTVVSRYLLPLVDHDGDQTNYGEPGANVLISAPSDGSGVGITTTDNVGNNGYTSSDYTSNFGGTSSQLL